ncbi:MAG: molybdopterin-guanine dinucleotide biosynthesis protein A [Alphaproteobacteria bacterium]
MRKRLVIVALWFGLGIFSAATGAAPPAWAGDRHAGYYYPEPVTHEVYEARSETLPEADRATRIGFVTGIAKHVSERPYPPQAAMFAKGTEAEKLIIVALVDGRIDTLYRARAVLANMTAAARMLPAFQEMGVQDWFTFLDLAHMLGFKQITISDGRDFAHQLIIE